MTNQDLKVPLKTDEAQRLDDQTQGKLYQDRLLDMFHSCCVCRPAADTFRSIEPERRELGRNRGREDIDGEDASIPLNEAHMQHRNFSQNLNLLSHRHSPCQEKTSFTVRKGE